MRDWFIWSGIALCLFSLWAIARHDWLRLTRPARKVMARVTGHRTLLEDGAHNFAAIYGFTDETGTHEVVDQVYSSTPPPAVGSLRELAYPEGRPDLARPPRKLMWAGIYLLMLAMPCLLFGVWMGWLR